MKYRAIEGSHLGHSCCFGATVIDVPSSGKWTDFAGVEHDDFTVVCECHDLETAERIATALNERSDG